MVPRACAAGAANHVAAGVGAAAAALAAAGAAGALVMPAVLLRAPLFVAVAGAAGAPAAAEEEWVDRAVSGQG